MLFLIAVVSVAVGFWLATGYTAKHSVGCLVLLTIEGKRLIINGYIDTGNRLIDPYSGKPVSVIDRTILPPDFRLEEQMRFHYVPYKTVGCECGLMPVFEAKECTLVLKNRKRTVSGMVIGVSEEKLSERGEYSMLLNYEQIV